MLLALNWFVNDYIHMQDITKARKSNVYLTVNLSFIFEANSTDLKKHIYAVKLSLSSGV